MIRLEEIRIGNILKLENNLVRVSFITMIEGVYHIGFSSSIFSSFIEIESIDKFETVKLEPDYLLKIGFEKERIEAPGIDYWDCYFYNGIELHYELDSFILICKDVNNIKVEYLHQLQNIYYMFKNKELNLNF